MISSIIWTPFFFTDDNRASHLKFDALIDLLGVEIDPNIELPLIFLFDIQQNLLKFVNIVKDTLDILIFILLVAYYLLPYSYKFFEFLLFDQSICNSALAF